MFSECYNFLEGESTSYFRIKHYLEQSDEKEKQTLFRKITVDEENQQNIRKVV